MSGCDHELEAELSEPDQSREVASPASHKEEKVIPIRPQRDKRPSPWLEDFITGGELGESLAVQPEKEIAAVYPIEMAQRQLEHPPAINIQDMWHLSDEERRTA